MPRLALVAFLFSLPLFAATTSYRLDPTASKVEWLAKKLAGQHNGTLVFKEGQLDFDGDSLKGGFFVVDMQSIKVLDVTDPESNKDLTEHLKSDDFFSATKNNTSQFTIRKVEKQADGTYHLTGPMEIKGIRNDISVPMKVEKTGADVSAKGKVTLDRTKWDIKYRSGKFFPEIGDKMIYDNFDIDFDVKAKSKSSPSRKK
jgi:polyisoprenoid-binding protein YceI